MGSFFHFTERMISYYYKVDSGQKKVYILSYLLPTLVWSQGNYEYYSSHRTMNIFGSKSGHLSNRIIEIFFFIFSKHFAVFDDFSKWRVPNVLQNSEKSSNIAKIVGK